MENISHRRGWLFLLATLFYVCIAVFVFREAVFTDRVQVCNDITMTTYPWALERPEDFKVRNPALSDQCTVFYSWFHYTAKMLKEGELPLWTPHALGGAPYMGNLSTAIFYPLNLLIAVMPVDTFFLVQSLIKLVLAGVFMYLFLRILGMKFGCSLFGGMVYSLCGYTLLWVISHLTSVSVLMPALFFATELYIKRRNGLSLGLITVLLALQFIGAQPETSLCMVTAWGIYTLFRIRNETGLFTRDGALLSLYLVPCGVLAIGLVLFQLWPFVEYMVRSYGLYIRERSAEAMSLYGGSDPLLSFKGMLAGLVMIAAVALCFVLFKKGRRALTALLAGLLGGGILLVGLKAGIMVGIKPHILIQLFPDLYGNPLEGVRTAGGAAYPEFNGGYAGALCFFLAMIGWIACWKRSPVRIMGTLFLLSFGAVHGIPFLTQFVRALPGFELTQPGRIICVTAFTVSALCAFGLDFLMRRAPARGSMAAWRVIGVLIVGGLAVFHWKWDLIQPDLLPGSENDATTQVEAAQSDSDRGDAVGGTAGPDTINPGTLILESPQPGQRFTAREGILIKGMAGMGLTNITCFLSGLSTASMALDPTRAQPFECTVSMDRFEEGAYSLGVKYTSALDGQEHFMAVPVTVTHAKTIAQKDWIVVLASAVVLALLFLTALPVQVRLGLALAMALVDLLLFGASYNCTSEPGTIFPDTWVTDYLSEQEGVFRILPEEVIIQPSTNYVYEYQILRGYDGLELPEYNLLLNLLKRDPWVGIHSYSSKTLDYENPVLDLLGVKYVLSLDDLSGIPGLRLVRDDVVKIYENVEAMSRAFVVGNWINTDKVARLLNEDLAEASDYLKAALTVDSFDFEEVATSRDSFIMFVAGHFNFADWALLEKEVACKTGGSGEVKMTKYENDYIAMDVEMTGEGLLIFTENHYPGWKALVDGVETEILRANITFKAIPLKDGKRKVELIYAPASFYVGVKVAIACLVLLLILMFAPFIRAPLKKTGYKNPIP